MSEIKLYKGDCLIEMQNIPDKSIDMILCDLPYGTTACNWDSIIDFEELWTQYERIIKDDRAIVLFSSGSFTYKLMKSNENLYRYKWVWLKSKRCNFVNAKNRPMTDHEEILVFSKGTTANGSKNKMLYNPQGLIPKTVVRKNNITRADTMIGRRPSHKEVMVSEFTNYPCDVLEFASEVDIQHPTQKPVELLGYLIKTYSNDGETVLDNTMGSGSTGVACVNTKRNFIGIELNEEYFAIAEKRIKEAQSRKDCQLTLF